MSSAELNLHQARDKTNRKLLGLPGIDGIWIFITGDILVFSLMFLVYSYYRALSPEVFHASHLQLHKTFGLVNTILLLTSSWFVVTAVDCARNRLTSMSKTLFVLAFCCGTGFIFSKYLEYSGEIAHGVTMMTNDFFMFYYVLTAIHCVHVLVGLAGLGFAISRLYKPRYDSSDLAVFESAATFWHMVDLLWIVLFPLLYLLP